MIIPYFSRIFLYSSILRNGNSSSSTKHRTAFMSSLYNFRISCSFSGMLLEANAPLIIHLKSTYFLIGKSIERFITLLFLFPVMELNPILLGFIAGITVYVGAIPIVFLKTDNRKILGSLTTIAAGILLYLALDIGSKAEELVMKYAKLETIGDFLIRLVITAFALLGVWLSIQYAEKKFSGVIKNPSLVIASTASLGLGLHNVGEGVGIAAALLSGSVVSAMLFTIGFAVHNATEGFGIVGALQFAREVMVKQKLKYAAILSAIAGFPVMIGASVYYIGSLGDVYLATLYSASAAAVVFAANRMIIYGSGRAIGYGMLFWLMLFIGVALAFTTEGVLELSFSE